MSPYVAHNFFLRSDAEPGAARSERWRWCARCVAACFLAAPPEPAPPPPPQLRQNFQSFLTGGVVALAFGYYRVHQDIYVAAGAVDARIEALGSETVSSVAAMQKRVKALEQEVAALKALKG